MKEGRKDDTGKLRFDLFPPGPLFKVAEVFTIGCKRYDDRNWEKGMAWGRVFAAMMRHAWKWWKGEKYDTDDGQHHLGSVAWCALVLMEYEETHPDLDDRSISVSNGHRPSPPGSKIPFDSRGNTVVTAANGGTFEVPVDSLVPTVDATCVPSK